MAAKIHFVFWDSDNTLVETAEHHWRKHVETLKKHNIDLSDEYRQRIYENNGSQNWEWLTEDLNLNVPRQQYLSEIDAWYNDHLSEIKVRSGVIDALNYFKKHQVMQAVVSNGRRDSVMAALEEKNLAPYFKFILCKEDYTGRKPSPAPYLTALKKMQDEIGQKINPEHCLVVEDDPLGVQSGEAAGMIVLHRPMGDDKPFDLLIS